MIILQILQKYIHLLLALIFSQTLLQNPKFGISGLIPIGPLVRA